MNSLRSLFRRACDAALAGTTVVVPGDPVARAIRRACETRMASSGKPWHTPRALSWGAFVSWMWREAMMTGSVGHVLLSREQQRVVWEQVIANSPDGARLMNVPGAAVRAREAWDLIQAFGIEFPSAAFHGAPETKAFARWATEFLRVCKGNGWVDNASAASELTSVAASLRGTLTSVATYGFDSFTPQQQRFVDGLRAAGITVDELTVVEQLRLDRSTDDEHVRQFAANDMQHELRSAAAWTRSRIEETPSAQIGVLVPRLSALRSTVEQIFAEVLHLEAFFSGASPNDLAFEIAVGTPLVEHGIVDTALRALRLASGAVSLEEACRLVRSPYIAGARAERAPRGLFDLALRKCKLPQITPEGLLDEARKAKCPTLAKQLAAFAKHAAVFTEPHSASKWAQHFSAVLTALGWPCGNDEPRLSADEYQAHEAFLDLLRWFSALEVVRPTTISATQALSEFTRMVRDMSVRHKDSNAPVQVLSLADAPGCVFDHLWICGMTDDAWPPRGTSNPFIPVALQHKCALPHSSFALDNIEAAKTLARLYAGAPDVIVSWPKRDKDVELRPAPQIAELPATSVNFGEAVASMSALIPLAEADCFADEQAPAASPGRQSGGTKMFEYQSTCPFRAFVQTRLNARAMKEAYAGPNYIERGERIEKVLELVWNELGDSIRLHELFGTPELQLIVERAVDAAIREFVPQAGRWFDNYRVVERSRLVQLTLNWLDVERERAPFHSVVHQHETEIAVGELSIEARVDRMDKLPSGEVVIIDYKTGDNFSSKLWQTPRMDAPQLPLYAMTQAPGSVAAVAFGVVRTDGCDLAGITRDRKIFGKTSGSCEREMTREIAQWRTEMESLAAAYLAGEAAVDPKTAHKTCKWCHLKPVCRVAEGSSAEVAEGGNDA